MKSLSPWLPAAIWLTLMAAATSIPHLDTSRYPGADKAFHFVVYAVWAMLCLRMARMMRWRGVLVWLGIVLAGVAVGAADELHERLIPGRTVSPSDFLCNAAGFLSGLVA